MSNLTKQIKLLNEIATLVKRQQELAKEIEKLTNREAKNLVGNGLLFLLTDNTAGSLISCIRNTKRDLEKYNQ